MEQIAMWGGIAGIVVAVVAIIVLLLTRKNILDILNKDAILFDHNFEVKKQAISKALTLTEDVLTMGDKVKTLAEFKKRAKDAYNDLLCVVSNVEVADEFYEITLNQNQSIDPVQIAEFKLLCRKDIGLKTKKAMTVARVIENSNTTSMAESSVSTQQKPTETENKQ